MKFTRDWPQYRAAKAARAPARNKNFKFTAEMKNMLKLLICCGTLAALMLAGCSGDSTGEKPHKTEPLLSVLDHANMMYVEPVGLGDRAKKTVIRGRFYRNFVQLLRQADAEESLQDTFKTECPTGLRIRLYRDTSSVGELRIAEKIGRIGDDVGTWTPKNAATMKKVNGLIRGMGINSRPCATGDSETLAGPENVLYGMILEADTAIGIPLDDLLRGVNEVTIYKPGFIPSTEMRSFVDALKEGKKFDVKKESALNMQLDSSQVQELLSLLRNTKRESYEGHCLCIPHLTISFFRNGKLVLKLNALGKDYRRFEKNQQERDYEKGGYWESADPQALREFIKRVSAAEL